MVWIRSILLLGFALVAWNAGAHELEASIADITIEDDRVVLDLTTNLEARLAGIAPVHEDTGEAPEAAEYDALRTLEPAALEERLRSSTEVLLSGVRVEADGEGIPLRIESVRVPEVGRTELPRDSFVRLVGDRTAANGALTVTPSELFGDLILRGTGDNLAYSEYLRAGAASAALDPGGAAERSFWDVFVQYIGVGFEHIVPLGLDHILFVVALFLASPGWRSLLIQVSAFTLAHTVTLALATLDIVRVPGSIVEPLIALSIAYVAAEALVFRRMTKWRPALVFAFGLLHGLGFASVFEDYGIPEGQLVAALLAFNIGVEIGQIAVLAACFLVVGWARERDWYRWRVAVPGALMVGAVGLFWFVERIA